MLRIYLKGVGTPAGPAGYDLVALTTPPKALAGFLATCNPREQTLQTRACSSTSVSN